MRYFVSYNMKVYSGDMGFGETVVDLGAPLNLDSLTIIRDIVKNQVEIHHGINANIVLLNIIPLEG